MVIDERKGERYNFFIIQTPKCQKGMKTMGKRTVFLYLDKGNLIRAGVLDAKRRTDVEVFNLLSKDDYVAGDDKHNACGILPKFPKVSPFHNMSLGG